MTATEDINTEPTDGRSDHASPTPAQVLALPLDPGNDSGAETVRGYLVTLLAEVWRWKEGFGGKRPFGNSGWAHDLYVPLVKAGFIAGSYDEDGYVEEVDTDAGDQLIAEAIESLSASDGSAVSS